LQTVSPTRPATRRTLDLDILDRIDVLSVDLPHEGVVFEAVAR
jgi:hypothetical protein